MSHSYRHHSWIGMPKDGYYKRLVHKRNRMLARDGIYLDSGAYKQTVEAWDICDYSWIIRDKTDEWYEKGRRK